MATSMSGGADGEPGPLVSTQWLTDRLDDPRLRVFDTTSRIGRDPGTGEIQAASGREDWARCHIPGSGFMDPLELMDPRRPGRHMLPNAEDFAAAMSALGVGPDTHVIVYDSGAAMFATRLWWGLRVFGFDAVSVLDGGMRTMERGGPTDIRRALSLPASALRGEVPTGTPGDAGAGRELCWRRRRVSGQLP
jgi:thiosulfate/3-mercaptopyruvate sulfurtransferase